MEYSLVFIFKYDLQSVLLLEKRKGPYVYRINGVGGKIETTDDSPEHGALREVYEETGYLKDDFKRFEKLVTASYPSGTILHVYYGQLKNNNKNYQQKENEPLEWWDIKEVSEEYDNRFAGEGGPKYFVNASLVALMS
jgi:8-oxo-dGTP pyrophosphatase MutT (NUDIX family)